MLSIGFHLSGIVPLPVLTNLTHPAPRYEQSTFFTLEKGGLSFWK
jgi:hypothetical protein